MHVQVLIDSIVRQMTVLIAQLATAGGVRAPLAHLANQVFLDLAHELERAGREPQGQRRHVRHGAARLPPQGAAARREPKASGAERCGRPCSSFCASEGLVTRAASSSGSRATARSRSRAVLHDLDGERADLLVRHGPERRRAGHPDEELGRLSQLTADRGIDELAWVLVYRDGPLSSDSSPSACPASSRRSRRSCNASRKRPSPARAGWTADGEEFVIPLGASVGWEAAVFDHLQAVVQTICQRLRQTSFGSRRADVIGGSTYSFDVWPEHPLEGEVKRQLAEIRARARRAAPARGRAQSRARRPGYLSAGRDLRGSVPLGSGIGDRR